MEIDPNTLVPFLKVIKDRDDLYGIKWAESYTDHMKKFMDGEVRLMRPAEHFAEWIQSQLALEMAQSFIKQSEKA